MLSFFYYVLDLNSVQVISQSGKFCHLFYHMLDLRGRENFAILLPHVRPQLRPGDLAGRKIPPFFYHMLDHNSDNMISQEGKFCHLFYCLISNSAIFSTTCYTVDLKSDHGISKVAKIPLSFLQYLMVDLNSEHVISQVGKFSHFSCHMVDLNSDHKISQVGKCFHFFLPHVRP